MFPCSDYEPLPSGEYEVILVVSSSTKNLFYSAMEVTDVAAHFPGPLTLVGCHNYLATDHSLLLWVHIFFHVHIKSISRSNRPVSLVSHYRTVYCREVHLWLQVCLLLPLSSDICCCLSWGVGAMKVFSLPCWYFFPVCATKISFVYAVDSLKAMTSSHDAIHLSFAIMVTFSSFSHPNSFQNVEWKNHYLIKDSYERVLVSPTDPQPHFLPTPRD